MSFLAVHALEDPTADIGVKTLVGGDVSLLGSFFSASIRAGALGGQIYIATEAADTTVIRGMALWWGPGAEPFSTDEQRQELHAFVSGLSPEAQEWHRTIASRSAAPDHFAKLTEELLGPRGKLDSWYLSLLAVEPHHQRGGVARALIDAVRAKASGF
ncbi:hypothetical protein FB451DRAFT_1183726 [Mycena latifolia]|nr:hypothetical protein FB451DRAFT_1183726 [Mycena latifolia]